MIKITKGNEVDNNTCGVYSIMNITNNKVYIGSSVNIRKRWGVHRRALRKGMHHNRYLQRSWNKYGEDNFIFNIIEELDDESLIIREQYWIDFYKSHLSDNGFNMCRVAGSVLGIKWSEESRIKHTERLKGRKHSLETKLKISKAHKGKTMNFSQEYRERMSKRAKSLIGEKNPFFGKTHTEETRKRISELNKGKKRTEEFKRKIAESNRNRIVTEETRKRMSKSKRRENLSKETREKLSKENKGDKNPNAKLNEKLVKEIKILLKEGLTQQKIANKFNVSRALIGKIKNGQLWSHVEVESDD